MDWYKTLDIDRKINLKSISYIICGIEFKDLVKIFKFKGSINLLYNKLKREGFDLKGENYGF